MKKLDENTEKLLFDYISKNFPMVKDFDYEINEDMIRLISSTSLDSANPSLTSYFDVEEILNASFITVVSENSKSIGIFKFK